MSEFEYELDQKVRLVYSNEQGHVIGRAQYAEGANAYLVRYAAADGRQVEAWWNASAMDAVSPE
jgi:hypothetical protein